MSTRSRTSPGATAAAATTMASPLTPTAPSTSRNHQCQAISVGVLVIECASVCVCVWEGFLWFTYCCAAIHHRVGS